MSGAAASSGNSLDSLMSLLKLFHGSTSTVTGGGYTEGKQIDSATLQGLLKSALEGNQGLSSVVSGQQGAGMYNSTTNGLLTNDLLSRLITQTAALSAPTVRSNATQVTTGNKLGTSDILGLGASYLANKGIKGLSGGKSLSDLLGLSDSVPTTASLSSLAPAGESFVPGTLSSIGQPEMSIPLFDALAPAAPAATGLIADGLAPTALELSIDGGTLGGLGATAAGTTALASEGVGAGLGFETAGLTTGAGGVGLGEFLSTLLACFITTACCETVGRADDCHELTTLRQFRDTWLATNHPEDIVIYYKEAPSIVAAIKAQDNSTELFGAMYYDYVVPAVAQADAGYFDQAYATYKALFSYAVAAAYPSEGE